jgi:hypothetical protein
MEKIPKQMTSDFLLNSGYYIKVNFQQMLAQLGNIDENTPHIEGFKYTPSYRLNNKNTIEIIRPVKIIGTYIPRTSPVIVYIDDRGEKNEWEEELWSNNPKSKDGIYILSPELQKRWSEEDAVMRGAIDKKSSLSKLPTDMINTILSKNNNLYVKQQYNPYAPQQPNRRPLETLSINTNKQGGNHNKKTQRRRKTRKGRKKAKLARNKKRLRSTRKK